MRNWILGIAVISMTTSVMANEVPPKAVGEAPTYTSRDGTALSMMGWGLSLAVGIVTLVCLVPNHK